MVPQPGVPEFFRENCGSCGRGRQGEICLMLAEPSDEAA
jgi:hypothetical protein